MLGKTLCNLIVDTRLEEIRGDRGIFNIFRRVEECQGFNDYDGEV